MRSRPRVLDTPRYERATISIVTWFLRSISFVVSRTTSLRNAGTASMMPETKFLRSPAWLRSWAARRTWLVLRVRDVAPVAEKRHEAADPRHLQRLPRTPAADQVGSRSPALWAACCVLCIDDRSRPALRSLDNPYSAARTIPTDPRIPGLGTTRRRVLDDAALR